MPFRHLLALLLALAASGFSPLFSAEDAVAAPAESLQTPAPNPVEAGQSLSDLQAALPQAASLVVAEDKLCWQDSGVSFQVLSVDNGVPKIATAIGELAVNRKFFSDNRTDALALLPKLIDRAKAASLTADGFTFAEGIMTGIHLRSPDVLVLGEGVLRKTPVEPADRSQEIAGITGLTDRIKTDMQSAPFNVQGRKTIDDFVNRLSLSDDSRKFDFDEVMPNFARRVVRNGGFHKIMKDFPLADELQKAVAAAEEYREVTLFEGSDLRLREVKNSFGGGGWILSTPTRCAYTRYHSPAMYLFATGDTKLNLVVDLKPGSDPPRGDGEIIGAQLFQQSQRLASWSSDNGFLCDRADWRKAMPERGPHIEQAIVTDFLPPHIVVANLNGDVRHLITEHGVLTPPMSSSDTEAERFLQEAAKVLPDAAHMDLIGEHIFYYTYDSPDSRYPFLIGNKAVKGDIHQTALQTLDTMTGGMFRGDCDDLSELYQVIAEHQGRTAHVITLPAHAALAFAEKKDDQKWHVYVLQTGQPIEFSDEQLPAALKLTYSNFNEGETFDANGLGLLLRFSGENTRSQWRLSWRIFSEPEYAKTMIDVQKDWHFQTYQRGIDKMLKLIAEGDSDTANYRELSGLYSYTGQYALAVEYHQKALAATVDPESRLYSSTELISHLFEAKQDEQARAVALDILDNQLPALQKDLGPRAPQLGIELASALIKNKVCDLGERAIKDTMLDEMVAQIDQVSQWLSGEQFNARRWEQADQLRRFQQMFVGVGLALLEKAGPDSLPGDQNLQIITRAMQQWLTSIAFRDVDEPSDVLLRYSQAGHLYSSVLGRDQLLAMLDKVSLPTSIEYDHAKRVGGVAQLSMDLPWIKLSVPFWFQLLAEQFEREHDTLDRELVLRLGKQLADSYAACNELGFDENFLEHEAHLAALVVALVTQDEKTLRERLAHVKNLNDKRLRDDTAQWLGDPARFLEPDWYAKVLNIWKEELNYKPKYFWIAWRAALNKGPQQALMVAKMAAEEFSGDPSFTEEYEFMRKLLEQPEAAEHPDTPVPVPAAEP
jgi:hypothetical protein